jgi:ABC-type nitrate/sulfonate/bicarbonate transport system ATPase subunit
LRVVELKGVSKDYGEKKVLENLSLVLPRSGTVAVTGPSGSGKTTLLRLLAGLVRPDLGEALVPQGAKISMVFQEDRLLPSLDTRGNVLAVLPDTPESLALADDCLGRCGLLESAGEPVSALSGGMKRRVAIARAIAYGGDILLMDEPFKGLDAETKARVVSFAFEDKTRLIVFVTHSEDEIALAGTLLRFNDSGNVSAEALP